MSPALFYALILSCIVAIVNRLYPVRSFRHFETEPFNFIKVMCLVMILLLRSLTCDTWYCNAYQAFICGGLGNVNFCLSSFSSQFPKELDNVVTQIFSEIDHFPLAVNNSADSYIFKYPLTKVT